MDELYYYEEGHSDALRPIKREAHISFMGEHTDIRPATVREMKEVCAALERNLKNTLHASTTTLSTCSRQGEHNGPSLAAPYHVPPTECTIVAPAACPATTLSPPVGMCIPRVRANMPKEKRWLTFVKDWEEADPARGLLIPLKDWEPEWRSDKTFAMNYHSRKLIALEFIEK